MHRIPTFTLITWALALLAALIGLFCISAGQACAETIPHDAARYQRDLTRQAHLVWGLDAPVATLAAQIHTESAWRINVRSPVGARGIAQIMPGTAEWIAKSFSMPGSPENPTWAMRALVTYDRWLWARVTAFDACERMAMTLSAYNGGLGWLYKDVSLTRSASGKGLVAADQYLRWFGGVEHFNSGRAPNAFAENREYPRRVLIQREPLYVEAHWGDGVCRSAES